MPPPMPPAPMNPRVFMPYTPFIVPLLRPCHADATTFRSRARVVRPSVAVGPMTSVTSPSRDARGYRSVPTEFSQRQALIRRLLGVSPGSEFCAVDILEGGMLASLGLWLSGLQAARSIYCDVRRRRLGNLGESGAVISSCVICPGGIDTEFLQHRAEPPGAAMRAKLLQAQDVARVIGFVAAQPDHVRIEQIVMTPFPSSEGFSL